MKISKTFRLSKQAADILDRQPNATQFVESLILGARSGPSDDRYSNKEILTQLHKIKAKLLDIENSGGGGTTEVMPMQLENSMPTTRTPMYRSIKEQLADLGLKIDPTFPNQAFDPESNSLVTYKVIDGEVIL